MTLRNQIENIFDVTQASYSVRAYKSTPRRSPYVIRQILVLLSPILITMYLFLRGECTKVLSIENSVRGGCSFLMKPRLLINMETIWSLQSPISVNNVIFHTTLNHSNSFRISNEKVLLDFDGSTGLLVVEFGVTTIPADATCRLPTQSDYHCYGQNITLDPEFDVLGSALSVVFAGEEARVVYSVIMGEIRPFRTKCTPLCEIVSVGLEANIQIDTPPDLNGLSSGQSRLRDLTGRATMTEEFGWNFLSQCRMDECQTLVSTFLSAVGISVGLVSFIDVAMRMFFNNVNQDGIRLLSQCDLEVQDNSI